MKTYLVRVGYGLIFEVEAMSEAEARGEVPDEYQEKIVEVSEKGKGADRPLYIETKREGYGPDQCKRTMTVGELIAFLSDFDEDRPIYLRNDNGYTYGSITDRDILDPDEEV